MSANPIIIGIEFLNTHGILTRERVIHFENEIVQEIMSKKLCAKFGYVKKSRWSGMGFKHL